MKTAIQVIGKVAFAVTDITLFDRIWCLWELMCAGFTDSGIKFSAAADFRDAKRKRVNNFFSGFESVDKARATKQEDYDLILHAILDHFGTIEAANQYVTQVMQGGMGAPWFELYEQNRKQD